MPLSFSKPLPSNPWQGFQPGVWQAGINLEGFITSNHAPYRGDDKELTGPTERTQALWLQAQMLLQARQATSRRPAGSVRGGMTVASGPEYLDRRDELIVGMPQRRSGPATRCGGGDCRQVALYGTDYLRTWDEDERLDAVTAVANSYGFDIRLPAATARQAIQWTYLGWIAAIEAGAGCPVTMTGLDSFFDIYLQRDIERGILVEEEAQELIDDLFIKLRLMGTATGDEPVEPVCLQVPVAGGAVDGTVLVTRTSFRVVNTLYTLGPAAKPHLIVLWSADLPASFRQFCAEVSIDSSALRYTRDLPIPAAARVLSLTPKDLGSPHKAQAAQLALQIDDELVQGEVLGINVFNRETLDAALARPHKYAHLTVQLPDGAVDLQTLAPTARRQVLYTLRESLA